MPRFRVKSTNRGVAADLLERASLRAVHCCTVSCPITGYSYVTLNSDGFEEVTLTLISLPLQEEEITTEVR